MSESQQPNHDLLEEAIDAFQRMNVSERPAGTETLALLALVRPTWFKPLAFPIRRQGTR